MDLRAYDPAIARWTGIDPVTHHSMSPYMAFDGNPVFWADPSGANSETFFKSKFLNKNGGHWTDRVKGITKGGDVSNSNETINGVSGNLKFAKGQSKEFKYKINGYVKRIASTEIGNQVLKKLIYSKGTIEISEVKNVLESVTTAEASSDGKSLTGNGTLATSLGTLFHDGASATGITTFGHELWHAYQIKMGTETYQALHTAKDGLNTRYSEIQAVGFENYLRGQLNISGGPRFNYSSRDNPLNFGNSMFSAPIHLFKKPGRFWGTNKWDLEDFSKNRVDEWRNLHNKALKQ